MSQSIINQIIKEYGQCDIEINVHGVDAVTMLKRFGMDAVNGKIEQVFEGGKITIYSADYLPFLPREKTHYGGGIVE